MYLIGLSKQRENNLSSGCQRDGKIAYLPYSTIAAKIADAEAVLKLGGVLGSKFLIGEVINMDKNQLAHSSSNPLNRYST
jgi:hypothetical protein